MARAHAHQKVLSLHAAEFQFTFLTVRIMFIPRDVLQPRFWFVFTGFYHDSVQMLVADQILEWESGRVGEGEQNLAVSPTLLVSLSPLESVKAGCTQP
jgi:hypothetical protein